VRKRVTALVVTHGGLSSCASSGRRGAAVRGGGALRGVTVAAAAVAGARAEGCAGAGGVQADDVLEIVQADVAGVGQEPSGPGDRLGLRGVGSRTRATCPQGTRHPAAVASVSRPAAKVGACGRDQNSVTRSAPHSPGRSGASPLRVRGTWARWPRPVGVGRLGSRMRWSERRHSGRGRRPGRRRSDWGRCW